MRNQHGATPLSRLLCVGELSWIVHLSLSLFLSRLDPIAELVKVSAKKIERKNDEKKKKRKNEIVVRHFSPGAPPPPRFPRGACNYSRRPIIIFLAVLFFSPCEPKLPPERDAERRSRSCVVCGYGIAPVVGVRRHERRIAREGRDSRQLIATPSGLRKAPSQVRRPRVRRRARARERQIGRTLCHDA